jgi:hypothetical protein
MQLPNGELTKSSETYADAWKRLYEPIEKMTGCRCLRFDTRITFMDGPMGIYETLEIPVWFAEQIVTLIENQTEGK